MSEELRVRLHRVDGSAPAIQAAASQLMKHYDRSAATAVNEWRSALMQATTTSDQLLPLLYVANEVLQTSKRNRGNKFLEAFSPVLKQALVYMAQQLPSPSQTEKIRRTVKIWGDRRVFSVRYVNELLQALEPYRPGHQRPQQQQQQQQQHHKNGPITSSADEDSPGPVFSPAASPSQQLLQQQQSQQQSSQDSASATTPAQSSSKQQKDSDEDSIMDILEAHDHPNDASDGDSVDDDNKDDYDDDDDDGLFDQDSERQTLNIEINVDAAVQQHGNRSGAGSPRGRGGARRSGSVRAGSKRRRSSASTGGGGGGKKTLSATHLLDLWNHLQDNHAKCELAVQTVNRLQDSFQKQTDDELSNLVGDTLQQAVRQHSRDCAQLQQQRRLLHTLANERYALQQEAARYLPWLEQQIAVQDPHEIDFCDTLELKVQQFQPVHAALAEARERRRQEDRERQRREAELERQRREREEHERFRRAALAKETEAKPGMVWNPTTREYQALNTDESWRD